MEKIKFSAKQLKDIQAKFKDQQLDNEIMELNSMFEYALYNNKNYISVESLSDEDRKKLSNLGFEIFNDYKDGGITISW